VVSIPSKKKLRSELRINSYSIRNNIRKEKVLKETFSRMSRFSLIFFSLGLSKICKILSNFSLTRIRTNALQQCVVSLDFSLEKY